MLPSSTCFFFPGESLLKNKHVNDAQNTPVAPRDPQGELQDVANKDGTAKTENHLNNRKCIQIKTQN